ncbi:MAG: hypothetical protein H7Y03_04160 [Chitinophagaceae bacterium]|nr:hypothetical protein [Chitinophagaceae bacterium]
MQHPLLKKLFSCLLLIPCFSFGQDITGLWKGVIYHDTTRQTLRYEVGISEEKGKLTGFSHTFFIFEDKEYFGLKKIKIRKVKDKYVIEDVELIADNYPARPPKGVHQISALNFTELDGVMYLDGLFTTTRTKQFHPATGVVHLTRKSDVKQSALIPHLTELRLVNKLSFIKPEPEEEKLIVKLKPKEIEKIKVDGNVSVTSDKIIENKNVVAVKVPHIELGPAAYLNDRKTETIETVYYKSDSLLLTLYDNGEVDGDTVSVLMNGNMIMPMQGLSTKAIKKTIYLDKNAPDSIQLLMYAENLGSIPPNTGLLVVKDGETTYEIRFSADMRKNSAIIFKRRK